MFSLVFAAYAVESDELNKVREWNMSAVADTFGELTEQSGFSDAALLDMATFVNEKDGKFSVAELSNECRSNMGETECKNLVDATISNHNNSLVGAGITPQWCEGKGMESSYCANCDPGRVKWYRLEKDNRHGNADSYACYLNSGTFEWLIQEDGTWDYSKGTCYIEVIGWYCLGGGTKSCDRNSKKGTEYTDCYMVRKYIDAKKPFKCDIKEVAEKHTGKKVFWAGCAQHGYGQERWGKKPPFNISEKWNQYDCQFPLASHLSSKDPQATDNHWRFKGGYGETPNFHADGSRLKTDTTSFNTWCIANECTKVYDKPNTDNGDYSHLIYAVKSGETVNFWNDKFPHRNNKGVGLCKPGPALVKCADSGFKTMVVKYYTYVDVNSSGYKSYKANIDKYNSYVRDVLGAGKMTIEQCEAEKRKINNVRAGIKKQETEMNDFNNLAKNFSGKSVKVLDDKGNLMETKYEEMAYGISLTKMTISMDQSFGKQARGKYTNGGKCTGDCHILRIDDIVTCKFGNISREYIFKDICD